MRYILLVTRLSRSIIADPFFSICVCICTHSSRFIIFPVAGWESFSVRSTRKQKNRPPVQCVRLLYMYRYYYYIMRSTFLAWADGRDLKVFPFSFFQIYSGCCCCCFGFASGNWMSATDGCFWAAAGSQTPLTPRSFSPVAALAPNTQVGMGQGGTLLLLLLHCLIYYLSNWRPQEVNLGLSLGPPLIPE